MKKFLRSFFKFCFFLFYIIDLCGIISYFSSFMKLGWRQGLGLIIFSPTIFILIILITSFFIGTILICESKKSLFANQLQRFGIEKTPDKLIEGFLTALIILFYVVEMFAILGFSYLLFEEIMTINNPNALPSSLNVSIKSLVIDLIKSIVPFIIVTAVLIIRRKKSVKENNNVMG